MEIKYIKGKENKIADGLSRYSNPMLSNMGSSVRKNFEEKIQEA